MSFLPAAEDFERLALRWVVSDEARRFPSLPAAMMAFPKLYAKNRDTLPQTDADRAFALTGKAISILDHQIIDVSNEEEFNTSTTQAVALIDEALKLDSGCHDAIRVQKYMSSPTREEMIEFLSERADNVCRECEAAAHAYQASQIGLRMTSHREMGPFIRPYYRWMIDIASAQLIQGRYHVALNICLRMIDDDPDDPSGFRLVAAYVYVKLEDEAGFETLLARFPSETNAWFLLSRLFFAYKARRFEEAHEVIQTLFRLYPHAGTTLAYQDELPAGFFGHLEFDQGSDDELFVALSEAAVILDENSADFASPLSYWIATQPDVEAARMYEEAMHSSEQNEPGGGDDDAGDA